MPDTTITLLKEMEMDDEHLDRVISFSPSEGCAFDSGFFGDWPEIDPPTLRELNRLAAQEAEQLDQLDSEMARLVASGLHDPRVYGLAAEG